MPDTPRAVFQVVQPEQQVVGGETEVAAGYPEGVLQIGQQLHGVVLAGQEALLEDGQQGMHGLLRPKAADGLGDVEQGFNQVLLAEGQDGREAAGKAEGFGS